MGTTRAFADIDWHQFSRKRNSDWQAEIHSKEKEYILKVDESDLKDYLFDKYQLEPLTIVLESESVQPPRKESVRGTNRWGEPFLREAYVIEIRYNYTGSWELFSVRPSTHKMVSYQISVSPQYNIVSFTVHVYKTDETAFQKAKNDAYQGAFANMGNINQCVAGFNRGLEQQIAGEIQRAKSKFGEENRFFEAINVKVNKDSDFVFKPPQIQKRQIPKPNIDQSREFKRYPAMAQLMYDDIIKLLMMVGRSMEQTPSTFEGKDEEAIRDQLLLFLATRYESVTATGESFNKGGKTDILLKYAPENINIFVAECKFWGGQKQLLAAIDQLFDRYLSARDTKVALLLFVRNKNFARVLHEIRDTVPNHPLFLRCLETNDDSQSKYDFKLSLENDTSVQFTVMAFSFPEA